MIKTRFAPSPTGYLHVGGLRTALFAYLYAKKHGGTFLLRIEDTDRERLVEGAIENILEALEWANICPDEGVVLSNGVVSHKGNHGPYIQSERMAQGIYQTHAMNLVEKGLAYYAFDTSEALDEMREAQVQKKLPPRYDRLQMKNSLTMTDDQVKESIESGTPYVIRLHVPEGTTSFTDLIRGEITFNNAEVDDQILIKSDGFPTYHFAVVVDDHDMEITHVIRGEEWIPSTPKHVMLYQMLGWDAPQFAHLPLLVNEEKKKLSKRFGDVSVKDFKESGYLPEALINFIAFLGWNPGTEKELYTLQELITDFDISQVAKSAAVFNREKLNWYNEQYIKNTDTKTLVDMALPELHAFNDESISFHEKDIYLAIELVKERASTTKSLASDAVPLLQRNESLSYEKELLAWKKSTLDAAKVELESLYKLLSKVDKDEWSKEATQEKIMTYITENGKGNGDVLWPLRVSLSGSQFSPGPFELLYVLGKEESLRRMHDAIIKLGV